MELHYKSRKLEKTLTDDKQLCKSYGTLAKKIKQRINQLKSADNLGTIAQLPVLRLHPYKADPKGLWSIDIQQNWRILFTIGNNPLPVSEDGCINIKEVTIIKIEQLTDPH